MRLRRALFMIFALYGLAAPSDVAMAQNFPLRAVTGIVPAPAGGPLDVLVRVMAERMRQSLGQPLVIENVSGAGGTVGVGRVVRATPDGHTISVGYLGTHVLNGAIFRLQYDLSKDFEPVAMLPSTPLLIAGKRALPAKSLTELMDWLKTHSATVATPGVGSPSHVMGVSLQNLARTSVQFVHYRGGGPALQDLLAGHVDLLINQPSILLPHLRENKIKVYAVLSKNRLPQAPDIPTADEEGAPDFHMSVWHGLWAPKARLRTSSPSSTLPLSKQWPMPRCAPASSTWDMSFQRESSKRQRHLAFCKRRKSRSGGQSSRPQASSRNESRPHRLRR